MNIIPKYQQGGLASYFATYTAVQTPQIAQPKQATMEQTAKKESKDTKDENVSQKDIVDLMKNTKGLANEMQISMSQLLNSLKLSEMLGASSDDLLRTYAQFKVQAEIMANNKAEFDKAVDQLKKDGALTDPVISTTGKLVYQKRDGKLGEVSVETYLANKNSYTILSNDQFTKLRQYSKQLAFDQDYINVLDNSMSAQKFDKLIDDLKGQINSSEFKYNTLIDTDRIQEGLKTIQNLSRKEKQQLFTYLTAENASIKKGVYNISITDKTNKESIEAAINYITSMMPKNAQIWASYKTGEKNPVQATKEMVTMALSGMGSQTTDYQVDYEGTSEEFKSKNSKDENSEQPKSTWLTNIQNGYGGEDVRRTYNEGSSAVFTARGTYYGGFLDKDGKSLTDLTANDLLQKTGISGISNVQSVYFGNQKLTPAQLSKVAIQNNGITYLILPCIKQNGSVMPDFSVVTTFENIVNDIIEKNPNASPQQREQLITKRVAATPALRSLLTASGRLDSNKFGAFLLTDGLVTDQYLDIRKDNEMVTQTEDQSNIDYYKNVVKGEFDDFSWYNPGDWLNNYTHLYQGTIYIPVTNNNPLSALLYSGQQPKEKIAREKQDAYQKWNENQKINHINPMQGWQ